ncbi:MAG: hypothetical protein R6U38_15820 [Desulfatiglandaceae bacterium]
MKEKILAGLFTLGIALVTSGVVFGIECERTNKRNHALNKKDRRYPVVKELGPYED